MGEVVTAFMPRRVAIRYVEILRKDGKEAAVKWWREFPWAPNSDKEKEEINNIIKEIVNKP